MSATRSYRAFRVATAAAALGVLLAFGVSPALAQTTTTGYVNPTTTAAPCPNGTSADLGTLAQGQTGAASVGGFGANVVAQLALNGGSSFGTATSDANGCVTVSVTVVNGGVALSLLRPIAAQGVHLAATGATVTINGVTGLTAKAPGAQNVVSVTGTGAAGNSRTDSVLFKTTGSGAAGTSLSRTGAMILRWTIVGIVLIAIGAGVLVLNRRRHATAS
jgi:hypothetical protein